MTRANLLGLAYLCVASGLALTSPLLAAGAVVFALLLLRRPTALIALTCVCYLIHPNSQLGLVRLPQYQYLAIICVTTLLLIVRRPAEGTVRLAQSRMTAPVALAVGLVLLASRLFLAGNDSVVPALLVGAAVGVGAFLFDPTDYRALSMDLGLLGSFYALATIAFGEFGVNEARFAGLAGNPNRMTFALLVLLPFIISLRGITRILAAPSAVAVFIALGQSGSAQAAAVAAVMGLAYLGSQRTLTSSPRRVFAVLVGAAAFASLWSELNEKLFASSDDLSGRTTYFRAALRAFASSPLVGNGSLRVTLDEAIATTNSAHNTYLAILGAAGLLVGLPLALFVTVLSRRLPEGLKAGNPFSYSAIAVCLSGLVQTIELLPITWLVLAASCAFVPPKESEFETRILAHATR